MKLTKAWTAYQESEDFKKSASRIPMVTPVRPERGEAMRLRLDAHLDLIKGVCSDAFKAGFAAAGGKVSF